MLASAFTVTHLVLITIVVYSCLLFLGRWLIVRTGHKPRSGEAVPGPEEMGHHLVGMYYCNADDPRGWVPKSGDPKRSNGYTINMRHRAWVTAYNAVFAGGLVVITLIGIAAPFLSAR